MKKRKFDNNEKCPADGKKHKWKYYSELEYYKCEKCDKIFELDIPSSESYGLFVSSLSPETITNVKIQEILTKVIDESVKLETTKSLPNRTMLELKEIQVKAVEYKSKPEKLYDLDKAVGVCLPEKFSKLIREKLSTDSIPVNVKFISGSSLKGFKE